MSKIQREVPCDPLEFHKNSLKRESLANSLGSVPKRRLFGRKIISVLEKEKRASVDLRYSSHVCAPRVEHSASLTKRIGEESKFFWQSS